MPETLKQLRGAVNAVISDGPTFDSLDAEDGWDYKQDPDGVRLANAIRELDEALTAWSRRG